MRRSTKRQGWLAKQARSRMGLFIATVALFWSAQLLGTDAGPVATKHEESEDVPRRVLVISVPDRKLALTEDGRVLKVYSVAVGAAVTPSPFGSMKLVNKVMNPTWYYHGKVVAPGKSNPLGDRWMGLSENGYGIHGTNVPNSIGKAASHGCIRMGKHDVEELFSLVKVGDTVEIHGARDEQVAAIFGSPEVMTASSATPATTPAAAPRVSPTSIAVATSMMEEAGSGE